MSEKNQELSKESSIDELFNALVLPEAGCNVRPITLQQDEKDTRMMLLIRGEHGTASYIMAEVMTRVQDLFDLQEQDTAGETPLISRV